MNAGSTVEQDDDRRKCQSCGCFLREKNKGKRCWSCDNPGEGKVEATHEDLIRSMRSKCCVADYEPEIIGYGEGANA